MSGLPCTEASLPLVHRGGVHACACALARADGSAPSALQPLLPEGSAQETTGDMGVAGLSRVRREFPGGCDVGQHPTAAMGTRLGLVGSGLVCSGTDAGAAESSSPGTGALAEQSEDAAPCSYHPRTCRVPLSCPGF